MGLANIRNIIADLNDLGIDYPEETKEAISAFYKKHSMHRLCVNKLMYIIYGLSTIHSLASTTPHAAKFANELLDLIYAQNELCVSELNLIAESLFEFHCRQKLSKATTDALTQYAVSSLWINSFFSYLKILIYPSKMYDYANALPIISKNPYAKSSSSDFKQYGFAYHEIMGKRLSQEDAIVWSPLDENVLDNLSIEEVSIRMWTAYRNLHDSLKAITSGTTASTTISTKNHVITSTLSDTIAYLIVYKNTGKTYLHRLNKKIRHPDDHDENQRIVDAGGFVKDGRVQGDLSPPRAIGDKSFTGICADADIDVFDLSELTDVAKIQVLTACDGFLEPLIWEEDKPDTKRNCEDFLGRYLQMIVCKAGKPLIKMSEHEICELLVNAAFENGSEDNISICIQTIRQGPHYFVGMQGIYDGHGGTIASHHVASNIIGEIKRLLGLSPGEYAQETNNAFKYVDTYNRDNDIAPISTLGLPPGLYGM